jgi:hypothetical protein
VLEALLKRVNGLEKRLKDENKPDTADDLAIDDSASTAPDAPETALEESTTGNATLQAAAAPRAEQSQGQMHNEIPLQPVVVRRDSYAVATDGQAINPSFTDALIDTYFSRLHGKPYYILDEPATRQRWRDNQLPRYVVNAIHAVTMEQSTPARNTSRSAGLRLMWTNRVSTTFKPCYS